MYQCCGPYYGWRILILVNLNLNIHMWLVATALDNQETSRILLGKWGDRTSKCLLIPEGTPGEQRGWEVAQAGVGAPGSPEELKAVAADRRAPLTRSILAVPLMELCLSIIPISQRRRQRLRVIKSLAQGHTAAKWEEMGL